MTNHLTRASRLAISAHQDWQQAASDNDLPESTKASLRTRGNEAWDEAAEALRLHGLYALIDDDEQPGCLADFDDGMHHPDDFSIDLKPLDRLHRRWQLMKFVNRAALVVLLLAVGYMAGSMSVHESPELTAADLSALHAIEIQLEKGATK